MYAVSSSFTLFVPNTETLKKQEFQENIQVTVYFKVFIFELCMVYIDTVEY